MFLFVCCLWWPNNFPSSTTTPPPPQSPLSLSKPLVPQTTQQQSLKNKTGGALLAPRKSPVCTKFGCYLRFGLSSSYQKFPASKLTLQLTSLEQKKTLLLTFWAYIMFSFPSGSPCRPCNSSCTGSHNPEFVPYPICPKTHHVSTTHLDVTPPTHQFWYLQGF